jgi:hypothetical protein
MTNMTKLCINCKWCDNNLQHPMCRCPEALYPVGAGWRSCYLVRSGMGCLNGAYWEPINKKWWEFWK